MSTAAVEAPGTARMSMSSALNSALDTALELDPRVILLGEDIADPAGGVFKTTRGLSTKHGADRVRATPIAEQSIVGAAIGAAMAGYLPVAEVMFFDFMTVCMDQIVNHAAKIRYMSGGATSVPLTIRTMVGSSRFGAQHAQELEAWFMHTPGLKVVTASTAADAKGLLLSCIFDPDPCIFIEHSSLVFSEKGPVPTGHHLVPLGVADVRRAGTDATIVTYGAQVRKVLRAAENLAREGIECEVIDLRSLVPLDMDTVLESVAKTRRAVIVHNATTFCGPGAELACLVTESLFSQLAAPVVRLGARNVPIPFALELDIQPTVDDITEVVTRLCGG
jgi:pyruvate/2-oxoglutarate/acetoin dehydrogenase E1 component